VIELDPVLLWQGAYQVGSRGYGAPGRVAGHPATALSERALCLEAILRDAAVPLTHSAIRRRLHISKQEWLYLLPEATHAFPIYDAGYGRLGLLGVHDQSENASEMPLSP